MQMMRTEICSFGVKSVPIRTPATDARLFFKNRRGKVTPLDTGATRDRASAAAARERSMRDPSTPVAATGCNR